MTTIELVTIDGKSIYQGIHPSINDAIETAIRQNISLDRIDLSNSFLHHINLDGVRIENGSFKGADLTGANMSEATFSSCDFSSANLENACLCYSNFNDCNFRSSEFRDTDIAMSSLEKCDFEGFPALQLGFHTTFKMQQLTYFHFGQNHSISAPPTLVQSGSKLLAILDNTLLFKGIPHTFEYNNSTKTPPHPTISNIQSMIDFIKSGT